MKLLKKKVPALFLILLVVLSLTVPALAASSTDTAAAPAAAETTQTQSDATGSKFTLLHALIQAYVLTMLTALFYGEVSERPEPASGRA